MKDIIIEPFPNLKITDEAYNRDVLGNPGKNSPKNIDGKSMVSVNIFNSGKKRVNAMIPETSNGKTFMSVFPNPIQLYFSFAQKAFNQSEDLRNREFIKHSKKVNKEEKYILDVDADKTHPLYNNYLQLKIGSIIMLSCSLEAFVNSIIKEDSTHINHKGEVLDQEGIQRWMSLINKIKYVIPSIYEIDFKLEHKNDFDQISSLIRIRNEFVHLKHYNKSPFSDEYQQLFISLNKFKMKKSFQSVQKYMCRYKIDFIVTI